MVTSALPRTSAGTRVHATVLLALAMCALTGCMPVTPAPSSTTGSPSTSPGREPPRFLITCFYPDGSEVRVFTDLDEAWASTNYVRIDYCDAAVAEPDQFVLTDEETAVADVAAAGLPGADPTDLYLRALAACVRIPPGGDHGLATYPVPILEAALTLCPEAPHAGLMEKQLPADG